MVNTIAIAAEHAPRALAAAFALGTALAVRFAAREAAEAAETAKAAAGKAHSAKSFAHFFELGALIIVHDRFELGVHFFLQLGNLLLLLFIQFERVLQEHWQDLSEWRWAAKRNAARPTVAEASLTAKTFATESILRSL